MSVNINIGPQVPNPGMGPGVGMPGMGMPGLPMPGMGGFGMPGLGGFGMPGMGGNGGGGITIQMNPPGEEGGKCCKSKKKKKKWKPGLIGKLLRGIFGGFEEDKGCRKSDGHGHFNGGHGGQGHGHGGAPSIAINVMSGNRSFGF